MRLRWTSQWSASSVYRYSCLPLSAYWPLLMHQTSLALSFLIFRMGIVPVAKNDHGLRRNTPSWPALPQTQDPPTAESAWCRSVPRKKLPEAILKQCNLQTQNQVGEKWRVNWEVRQNSQESHKLASSTRCRAMVRAQGPQETLHPPELGGTEEEDSGLRWTDTNISEAKCRHWKTYFTYIFLII